MTVISLVAYALGTAAGTRNDDRSAARNVLTDSLWSLAGTGDAHNSATNLATSAAAGAGTGAWTYVGARTVLDHQGVAIGRVGSNCQRCGKLIGIAGSCERNFERQRCRKDEYKHFEHLHGLLHMRRSLECYPRADYGATEQPQVQQFSI